MQASDIPAKFPIPFAKNAGPSYKRAIPTSSQIGITDGAASLNDGFPPLNFLPVAGGGVPPFGQDANGILFESTSWDQWFQVGGPINYDASFSSSIGGYPKGAVVMSTGGLGSFWISTVDNNTSNPDTGGANWVGFTPISLYAVDGGSANAMSATIVPAPISLAAITGFPIRIKKGGSANTGATTLALNGFAATPILHADGTPMTNGELPAGGIISLVFDGTNLQLQSASATAITPAQLQQQAGNAAVDTGTANLITITLAPAPASLAALDKVPIRIKKVAFANTAVVSINANSFGGVPLNHSGGSAMQVAELPASALIEVAYDNAAGQFTLLSMTLPPGVPASVAQVEAGTDNTVFISPANIPYSDNVIKGFIIFKWSGSAIVTKYKSATILSISRASAGTFQIQMQGGLNFVAGFPLVTPNIVGGGSRGMTGMGDSFTGTDPLVTVFFNDAGGTGGTDPLNDVIVAIVGHTQN